MRSRFEWDEAKNLQNQAKHGVSFEMAARAFLDRYFVTVDDDTHSLAEKRYFGLGTW